MSGADRFQRARHVIYTEICCINDMKILIISLNEQDSGFLTPNYSHLN